MIRVLIVDDDPGTRETSLLLLRLAGIQGLATENGHGGLELAGTDRFDVILVDLYLPDISGLEVVRQLKEGGTRCPIVVVTAFPQLDSSFDAGLVGADGYVEGPLLGDDLLTLIDQAVGGRLPVRHPSRCQRRKGVTGEAPLQRANLEADPRVLAVMRALESQLSASVEALAGRVNLSASRLRHLFAAATGGPLTRFRQTRRVDTAAKLLRETHWRVSEVANYIGLEAASLDKAFRRRFGQSPTEYRAKYQAIPPASSPAATPDQN